MKAGFLMRQNGSRFRRFVWDVLFPLRCFSCGREGDWLCLDCLPLLQPSFFTICPICKRNSNNFQTCSYCQPSCLDGLWALSNYDDDLIRKMIHAVKYQYSAEVVNLFSGLVSKYFQRVSLDYHNAILIPIPLHRRRLLSRGFNQAQLFAELISKVAGGEVVELLRRQVYRQPQVNFNGLKRRENIKGVFSLNSNFFDLIKNKKCILVDDVFTTGATMLEGARVLKDNGCHEVWGIAISAGGL